LGGGELAGLGDIESGWSLCDLKEGHVVIRLTLSEPGEGRCNLDIFFGKVWKKGVGRRGGVNKNLGGGGGVLSLWEGEGRTVSFVRGGESLERRLRTLVGEREWPRWERPE